MVTAYTAAIDQGTTGTRFMVFGHDGQVVASAYQEHKQIYPQPGWVEHDALEIWDVAGQVVSRALQQSAIQPQQLLGIGVTNQRETTVVWDRSTGRPLYNAIVWQCTRTRDICQTLIAQDLEPTIRERTGLVIATYFSGPKIKWILDNVPGVREKAEQGQALFGNIDTWLIWNLTGGPKSGAHITDYTNASRTMLMNLRTLDWDDDILKVLGVPRAMLPAIRPSSDRDFYGYTTSDGPLGAMHADAGLKLQSLKVDGGAVANNFLMQLQADILGVPVVRPVVRETTALGAAYAAGLASGLWHSADELRTNWAVDRIFEPQWSADKREAAYRGWLKAVQRAMKWV